MQAGKRAAHERGEDRHKHEPDDDRGGDEAKANDERCGHPLKHQFEL